VTLQLRGMKQCTQAPHRELLHIQTKQSFLLGASTQRRIFLKALDHLALARLGERLEWNRR
jgi:hypothetical protein